MRLAKWKHARVGRAELWWTSGLEASITIIIPFDCQALYSFAFSFLSCEHAADTACKIRGADWEGDPMQCFEDVRCDTAEGGGGGAHNRYIDRDSVFLLSFITDENFQMAKRFQSRVWIAVSTVRTGMLIVSTAGSALIQACEKAGVTIPRSVLRLGCSIGLLC